MNLFKYDNLCYNIYIIKQRETMKTNITKEEFAEKLADLNLSKKDFASLCQVPYPTVLNWGIMKKEKQLGIPIWVEPFLDNYEKATKLDYIMKDICLKIKDYNIKENETPKKN